MRDRMDVFNEIDYLINLDIGKRNNRLLYEAARKKYPLCLKAAKFISKIEQGNAIITTGFPVPPAMKPETDGLLGAVCLANVFQKMNLNPVIVTDKISVGVFRNLCKSFVDKSIKIMTISEEKEKAKEMAGEIIDKFEPSFMISIERPGINKEGEYCNMNGKTISKFVGKTDFLFNEARNRGIKTIGIGDGGNELGMGNVFNAIPSKKIASVTKVDFLVVAGVSNWGAYGIITALSILKGYNFCHRSEKEREMIEISVKSGAVDGVTKKSEYSVDGITSSIHEGMVEILYSIAELSK